jgi:AsmA protein
MLYTLSSDFKNVDANKLLSAVSATKSTIYGPLAANVNGTFRGGPSDQMARSLDGTLSLDLRNGRIEGFSLMQELGTLGRFLNIPGPAKSHTDVTQLSTKFQVKDGVARTDDLRAILDSGTVSGAGTVNLVSQALDMKLTVVLSKEISQSVGGSGIGGFLNTALANRQGELIMPVIVTGTVQHPKFVPDAEKIARLRLQNVLPAATDSKGVEDLLQNLFHKPKKP